jgi:hypothetical protein
MMLVACHPERGSADAGKLALLGALRLPDGVR